MQRCVSRSLPRFSARMTVPRWVPRTAVVTCLTRRTAQTTAAALCTPARLCSSSSTGTTNTTNTTTHAPPPAEPASGAPATVEDPAALTAEEQAAADAIISRIQGLSPEDQALILNALQNPTAQKSSVMGGEGIGPATGEMVAAFTCGKCDYRMVKRFSKHAYTKGIVIVQCPNCRVKHLIADNLGWIEDEARNIEDILREKGESFTRVGDGDYQIVVDSDGPETKSA